MMTLMRVCWNENASFSKHHSNTKEKLPISCTILLSLSKAVIYYSLLLPALYKLYLQLYLFMYKGDYAG